MKAWLSRGFWVGLLYLIAFSKLAFLQNFVNHHPAGPLVHSLMVILTVVGFFSLVLRLIHYLFVS